MLSYFKINDPLRLVPLLLIAFLLKIPAFIQPVQYFEATHWFVIGEAMQQGTMYSDIWDGMAPFSATIYEVITFLFGRSITPLYILGILITFLQAVILNNMAIRAKVFESNTYLPAFIYVCFTSAHPALFTLSPTLMGLTLLMLALGNLLNHVEFRAKKDIQIIMIGLYIGLATLFYLPFIVYVPISIVLLLLFTNTMGRRYFLLIYGSFFPLISAFFYYWLKTSHPGYFISNFLYLNRFDTVGLSIGWKETGLTLSISLIFVFLGLLSLAKQRRLTNYQSRIMQLFFLYGLLTISVLFFERPRTPYGLVVFMPAFTYFSVHFINLIKRTPVAIFLSLLLVGGPFASLWAQTHNWLAQSKENQQKTNQLSSYASIVRNKSVMVLGSGKTLYNEAQLAGPFYDWGLSKVLFENLDYYDNLVFLQNQLDKSSPQVIIDLEGVWPQVERQLPLVGKKYFLYQPKVWLRK